MTSTRSLPCAPVAQITAALLALALVATASATAQDLVVRAGTLHTMAGAPIADGVVLVRGGKIAAVGPASDVPVPDDLPVLHAAVVTPGLVDAHTVVGLAGQLNIDHDQDQLDRGDPIQPELRALDAYDPTERLVEWVRALGVTTLHTGHGPGAVISGQTMVVKSTGAPLAGDGGDVLRPVAMLAVTLGPGATGSVADKWPGTRAKAVALLRTELVAAQEYRRKLAAGGDDAPERNLGLEALASVLDGDVPLLVTAHRHHDILAALRIADEFGVRVVLDGATEGHLVADRLAAAGVPVIVHPTMLRAGGIWDAAETINVSFENAARLAAAGVPIAMQSGYESYVPKTRVVLFEAALAAAHGLAYERALAAITIDAARLLGVDGRVGSLEVGKDGDLALYDGDPFEYVTHCVGVVIDGKVVSDDVR